MRKLIVAATALAFLSSTAAFAQTPAPGTAPAAQSGDTMSKAPSSSKMTKKKSKKSSKAKTESDTAK
jgi:hypothetical protein